MAGLGRKVFEANEVLTAADVNGYLMDQSIMVFASESARTTAIGTPSVGMFAFITGTGALTYYDGSAWAEFSQGGGAGGFENTFLLMGA